MKNGFRWFVFFAILVSAVIIDIYFSNQKSDSVKEREVSSSFSSSTGSVSSSSSVPKNILSEDAKIVGTGLVYFRSLKQDGFSAQVQVDPIEFFEGEAAIVAAIKDSGCRREKVFSCVGSLNNNFYIRNLSTSTQKLSLTLSTEVFLLSEKDSVTLEKIDISSLKKRVESWPKERLFSTVFSITVKNGKLQKVEEKYIP